MDAPNAESIGPYYASEDYISHSDVKKDLKDHLYHRARAIMLKRKETWVASAHAEVGTLLDIGCGTGYFLDHMAQSGWQVTGLEPDDQARELATRNGTHTVLPSTEIFKLSGPYDVITMWHVLEHVHQLEEYVDQIHKMLQPDGTLLIAVPNHTSLDAQRYGEYWAAYDVPRHLWHFSPQSMNSLLSRHGFSLKAKKRMAMDPYYVSLLSEKYAHGKSSYAKAIISGFKSSVSSKKNVDLSSSLVYIASRAHK